MSDQTFEQLWKRLLVYAPECPPALAQEFINTAYSRALSMGSWSGLRADSTFTLPGEYTTGTASTTDGLTTVTGVGTTWTSAMIGRQFFLSSAVPFYTIEAVGGVTALTLDRPFAGSNTNVSYAINLIYLLPPSDFLHFISVVDVSNNWKLHTGFTQERLDWWDPKRTASGTPWILAAAAFNSSGRPRFELWPRASDIRSYAFRYIKKPALLSAPSDKPIFPFRGDVLRHGALAELSIWPGTSATKNPYYDMNQHALQEQMFLKELLKVQREDQEIANTMINYVGEIEEVPYAPIDASFMQAHGIPF